MEASVGDVAQRQTLSGNERLLLDLVRRHQPIARAAVTGFTDLTQQSVHRLLEGLIGKGLIHCGPARAVGRGKPSPDLSLSANAVHSVGLSVNTDSAVLCLVDFNGSTVREQIFRDPLGDRRASIARFADALSAMLEDAGIARQTLCGMGFALTGFFVAGGRAFNAPEPLRDWSLMDFSPELEATFGLPVFIENNATAGAIGESLNGVGSQYRTYAYLSFNYGFGGGVIIDGSPYRGMNGNAGEFSGIYSASEAPHRPALQYLLRALAANGVEVEGVEDLRERFQPSWPGAVEWVESVVPQLDRMINTLSAVLDPQAIVFGGQLAPALGEMMIERTRFMSEHRYGVGMPRPDLVLGTSPGDPAATGAALLPLKYLYFR